LPDSTPQRHAVTIPGIKLWHLVHN